MKSWCLDPATPAPGSVDSRALLAPLRLGCPVPPWEFFLPAVEFSLCQLPTEEGVTLGPTGQQMLLSLERGFHGQPVRLWVPTSHQGRLHPVLAGDRVGRWRGTLGMQTCPARAAG